MSIGFDIVFILQHYVWFRSDDSAQGKVASSPVQQEQQIPEDVEAQRLLVTAASNASSVQQHPDS